MVQPEIQKGFDYAVADSMELRYGTRSLPIEYLDMMAKKLKLLLFSGDLDDVLGLDVKRVVYEIMSPTGRLWSKLAQPSQ